MIAHSLLVLLLVLPAQTAGAPLAAGGRALAGGSTWGPNEPVIPWRPFIDPIDLHTHWYLLLIPLSFGIAVTYKAVRLRTMEQYWRQVGMMTAQIVLGMVGLALASYLFVAVYARFIAERLA